MRVVVVKPPFTLSKTVPTSSDVCMVGMAVVPRGSLVAAS